MDILHVTRTGKTSICDSRIFSTFCAALGLRKAAKQVGMIFPLARIKTNKAHTLRLPSNSLFTKTLSTLRCTIVGWGVKLRFSYKHTHTHTPTVFWHLDKSLRYPQIPNPDSLQVRYKFCTLYIRLTRDTPV